MQVNLLDNEHIRQIKDLFDVQLAYPVEELYYSSKDLCETCGET